MLEFAFQDAVNHALDRLEAELDPRLTYHSLAHTRNSVLPAAQRLGKLAHLSAESYQLLVTAAAYHDIGYLVQHEGHEAAGCEIVRETLPRFNYCPTQIEQICQTIMATRLPQTPCDLLGELLADADLDVFGRNDLWEVMQTLYCEMENFGKLPSLEAFKAGQWEFISGHQFFSDAARELRGVGKQRNLKMIRQRFDDPDTVYGCAALCQLRNGVQVVNNESVILTT